MPVELARLEEIFAQAVGETDSTARAAYLNEACGEDAELRERVQQLLSAHEATGNFLRLPTADDAAGLFTPGEGPGAVIGPYKLLQQIGEGGFGVVFLAEQERPVRRRVALKIIKPGMDTRQVIARFEAERQALALMDHPNIARVLDAGTTGGGIGGQGSGAREDDSGVSLTPDPRPLTTSAGRPYFVMELVQGVPITDYCDQCSLTTRERLQLFITVCQAVQHAHQKGVIHRDIKPTNVLVAIQDGKPAPKIIDFGIAKALNQRLTEHSFATGYAQMIGTPLYMSPEQAELSPLGADTRSDIYSLGVVLYELLTGTTPFEKDRLHSASYDELRRILREEDPPRPSARLSSLALRERAGERETAPLATTLAERRRTDPRRLTQTVHGELDWIAMKCLEKDRNRRYETANALAQDIARYLSDEPVQACPPSAMYRLRKFTRRKWPLLASAVLIGFTLLIVMAAVAGAIGWVTRDRAAQQAILEERVVAALEESEKHFARYDLLQAMLAVRRADDLLAGASLNATVAQRAQRWRADVEMARRLEGIRLAKIEPDFSWIGANTAYRQAFRDYGIDVEAITAQEAARRVRASAIAQRLIWALDDWRLAKIPAGALAGGEVLLEIAQLADEDPTRSRVRRAAASADPQELRRLAQDDGLFEQQPEVACLLVLPLRRTNQSALALEVLRRAHRRHPHDFWLNFDTGWMLHNFGQWAEAAEFYRAAVALRPGHPDLYVNLGHAQVGKGDTKEGEALYREGLRIDPQHARAHWGLYKLLERLKRFDEARAVYEQMQRLDFSDHAVCNDLARYMLTDARGQHDPPFMLRLARQAVDLAPDFDRNWSTLGMAEFRAGNWQDAVTAIEKRMEISQSADGYDWLFLAMAYWKLGHREIARQSFDRATKWIEQNEPPHESLHRFREEAATLLAANGDIDN